ncbi:hypothetical protein [Curtobacterium sp. MCBA15_004]|uniref:hypothetical protein n=1 Tax=Curtobacterium sp. MCBA15_004 TaxID=1898733 RepID=UPI0015870873|nr:hypothetical protein [Curtobacterium sp. MCBA15_004]WIA95774.1 hypothetical protein QOL16_11710 [Curtobacterium sp. MCBA15_004]
MKVELNLPAHVVRRLAKGDWTISTGWGVRQSAALYRAEVAIAVAATKAVDEDPQS